MELRGTKEVQITSRRRRLKSRDQHLFLLSSLCVPTVRAHTFGHRTPAVVTDNVWPTFFCWSTANFRTGTKEKKQRMKITTTVSQFLVRTEIVSSWRPFYCFLYQSKHRGLISFLSPWLDFLFVNESNLKTSLFANQNSITLFFCFHFNSFLVFSAITNIIFAYNRLGTAVLPYEHF